jgi:biotin carboxyl carrier protein
MKIHVKIQDNTYEVVIDDLNARPIRASVDGETFEVWPEEIALPSNSQLAPAESSAPLKQVPIKDPSVQSGSASNEISAPIPGVIIDILVKTGDKVKHGQELCILEAMKMKNSIRANKDGVISEILISCGDQVKHGQFLIRFKY